MLSLLWNGFGGYDYVMKQTRNAAYLGHFPADMSRYIGAMPTWVTALWEIGVWGSVLGALMFFWWYSGKARSQGILK